LLVQVAARAFTTEDTEDTENYSVILRSEATKDLLFPRSKSRSFASLRMTPLLCALSFRDVPPIPRIPRLKIRGSGDRASLTL
jgi:hypothetical protein